MKKFLLILFVGVFSLIFTHRLVSAQKSIQFGQFTPSVDAPSPSTNNPPPQGSNAECAIGLAEEVIDRYKKANLLTQMENSQRQFLACDILTYSQGCDDSRFVDCSKGCYSYRGAQAQSVLTNPKVAPHLTEFHRIGSSLLRPYWIYTKTVGRFSMRNGFDLDSQGMNEVAETLGSMTCSQRVSQLEHHIETPLYFYPQKSMHVKVKIPGRIDTQLLAHPNGTFNLGSNVYSSLAYDLPHIDYKKPTEGKIIEGSELKEELHMIAEKLQFAPQEKEDFTSYWINSLPHSNYYFVSLFDEKQAGQLANWHVTPKPDTEIRYIFYFKPLVKKPSSESAYTFSPIPRLGFTVLDWGGIIDW